MQDKFSPNQETIFETIDHLGLPEVDTEVLRQYLAGQLSPKSKSLIDALLERSDDWAKALEAVKSEPNSAE